MIRRLCILLTLVPAALAPGNAVADVRSEAYRAWSVAAGTGMDGRSNVRLARQMHLGNRWLEGKAGHLTAYVEASLMLTHNGDSPGPFDDGASTVGAVALAPVLRWQFPSIGSSSDNPGIRPFVDIGTGVALLSDKDIRKGAFRSRRMGSYGQFENRVNIGAHIGERWTIAYQQLHYSNADLASRNDGLDLFMLALTRRL